MGYSKFDYFPKFISKAFSLPEHPLTLCIPHMNEEKAAISVEVTFKQSLES